MPIKKIIALCMLFCLNPAKADTQSYLNNIKDDPNALYAFFKEMPKGGELHYHLSGGAYPETMLSLAATGNYCLDVRSFQIKKSEEPCKGIVSGTIPLKPEVYDQTIRAWSMKDFIPGSETGHDHFFASFSKFGAIVLDYEPELLAEILERAGSQNLIYMEIMDMPDNGGALSFGKLIQSAKIFDEQRQILLANPDFQNNISKALSTSKNLISKSRELMACGKEKQSPGCKVNFKFQYYILRQKDINTVFAQALTAFEVAKRSPDIIAVNIVQPEDNNQVLRDYHQQMLILDYLHKLYPEVHLSLHAGELAPGAVRPEDLRFHIKEAIQIGHAERIGHGVSIAYEHDADGLVKTMAQKSIPVEINLSSNKAILNVSGANHPLHYYLNHQVPVVLSTDDEGILRTDLTKQYVEAVTEQGLDYPTLKNINRNGLSYSFLPGQSIWSNPAKAELVTACLNLDSPSCMNFIKNSPKAALQRQLEKELKAFEVRFD